MRSHLAVLLAFVLVAPLAAVAQPKDGVRLKDIGRVDGVRENQLVGYGLVTGLAGTGDSLRNRATRQSIANLLSQFDLNVSNDQIQSRNVAIVMVIARLPAYARPGDKLDITVTSLGDARSLVGGTLVLTPLRGPDNRIRALAQGPLSIGGYKYDLFGNLVQKNHPTVGTVPGGASVEVGVTTEVVTASHTVTFLLSDPDFTTASRVSTAINNSLGVGTVATPIDASSVQVRVPESEQLRLVSFLTRLENTVIEPDRRARVVVNERTGTVVAGGDVRISKVTISHGDLKVSITTDYLVSQPNAVSPYFGWPAYPAAQAGRTVVVPSTRINVDEQREDAIFVEASNTVADLVRALNRIKTSPRDVIAILQGIKAAGALYADLIIQ